MLEHSHILNDFGGQPSITCAGGGGGTPYNGLYGEILPERGIFLRLQVYEREGILLVEVYERVGKSVIWVCERAHRANRGTLWLYKFEKTFYFCDWFLFKRQFIYSSQKGCKVLNKVRERSYHVIRRYTKGVPFSWKTVYKRVRGWTSGRSLPAWKFVEYPPGACVASVSETSSCYINT